MLSMRCDFGHETSTSCYPSAGGPCAGSRVVLAGLCPITTADDENNSNGDEDGDNNNSNDTKNTDDDGDDDNDIII